MALKLIRKIFRSENGQPLLLIVLTVLALSASAGIWLITGKFNYQDNAYRDTRNAMEKVAKAVCSINIAVADKEVPSGRSYCEDVGDYPLSLTGSGTTNLLTRTSETTCTPNSSGRNLSGWCGPYWNDPISGSLSGLRDGWGNALIYNTGERKIISYGPNGANNSGSGDDLVYAIDENIVTSGLILNLDARKYDGSTFAGSGNAVTTWRDTSPSRLSGTLQNFNGTSGSGWRGAGTVADPYRLVFDGSNDSVLIPDTSLLKNQATTLCLWVNIPVVAGPVSTCGGNPSNCMYLFFKRNPRTASFEGIILNQCSGGTSLCVSDKNGVQVCSSGPATLSGNTWYHLCGTAGSSLQVYHNATSGTLSGYSKPIEFDLLRPFFVGRSGECSGAGGGSGTESNWDGLFSGSIANVSVYNRLLTSGQILQNCRAQKGRFSGVTCP